MYFSFAQERPIGSPGKTFFVAYPAATRSSIRENDSLRLNTIQHFIDTRIIIIVFAIDGTYILSTTIPAVTSIRSVKPYFKYRSIVCQQVMQLCIKVRQILRCTIISLMAIPWRKINSKLKSIFLTSLRQFFHHISLSVLPRRVLYTIFRSFERP